MVTRLQWARKIKTFLQPQKQRQEFPQVPYHLQQVLSCPVNTTAVIGPLAFTVTRKEQEFPLSILAQKGGLGHLACSLGSI